MSSTPRRPQIQQHLPRKHLTGDQVMVMEQNLVSRDQPGQWNPTLRMAQMRNEYDRLVKDLGMSPRGSSMQLPHHAQYDQPGFSQKYATGMPRVPSDRPWGKGGAKSGAKSARERRFKDADTIGSGVGGALGQAAQDDAATWHRMQMRINEMAVAGHITSKQAEQLKKLQKMQENLLREAQAEAEAALSLHAPAAREPETEPEGGSPVKMVAAAQQLLGWLDNPEVEEGAPPGEGEEAEPPPAAEGASKPETPPAEPKSAKPSKPATPAAAGEAAGPGAEGGEAEGLGAERPESAIPRKLAGLLNKNLKRVVDVFGEWDKDQSGLLTKQEFTQGLAALKMSADAADIDALFAHFDKDGSGSLDFKELQSALRKSAPPKVALKAAEAKARPGDKSVAERSKEAAEAVLRPEDLMSSQKGIDRVEEALRSGRLPSLSPDEGEDGGEVGGGASKKAGGESAVWSAIEARLLPHGLAAAPAWQQEMLQKVQWRVECKSATQRKQKELAHAKLSSAGGVPTWRPAKGATKLRPNLLSRELAQAQAKELALQEVAEEEQRLLAEAKAAGTSVSAFAKAKMHEAGVQLVAARMEDMDETPQHQRFLREAAAEIELETIARINKLAFYEQAMQQQQLERQTLQSEMAATQLGIAKVERGAQQGRADAAAGVSGRRKERLARDVCAVALKANQMEALTHTLMHIIGSLRKARKRHLEAAAGVQDKESQMDADSSFLMSSATQALEERP